MISIGTIFNVPVPSLPFNGGRIGGKIDNEITAMRGQIKQTFVYIDMMLGSHGHG